MEFWFSLSAQQHLGGKNILYKNARGILEKILNSLFITQTYVVPPADILMKNISQTMLMLEVTQGCKIYFSFMIVHLRCIKAALAGLVDAISESGPK